MLESIIKTINILPDYIGEGIIELIITIFGGLIVGYFTSKYFERVSEITRIEGLILEKKLDVYREIIKRMNELISLVELPPARYGQIEYLLEKVDINIERDNPRQISKLFNDPQYFEDTFLSIDRYLAENRMYYDNISDLPILVFQNYFAIYNRLLVIFKEQMMDSSITNKVKLYPFELLLIQGIGVLTENEFEKQINNVMKAIGQSMNYISIKHRKNPVYTDSFFNAPDGEIMKQLKDTIILKEKDKITKYVSMCVCMALEQNTNKSNNLNNS